MIRYPTPGTVAMIQGSPSRLRRPETVMRTALVKGSAFSSHARCRSSSALTTPPSAKGSETEHELLELEGLGEVVVGAELEPGDLVVETVGSGQHEDRHPAAGGDDAFGDLVAGRSGNVSVEDGDVVGIEAQQLQSGVAVTCDVCRDRFQA